MQGQGKKQNRTQNRIRNHLGYVTVEYLGGGLINDWLSRIITDEVGQKKQRDRKQLWLKGGYQMLEYLGRYYNRFRSNPRALLHM